MKYILIIGDGMADNPVPELDNKTPLQAASIPAMDRTAARSIVGNVVNCPAPLPAGSETAILSIMGCDPLRYFTGRSPMEAAASGISMLCYGGTDENTCYYSAVELYRESTGKAKV